MEDILIKIVIGVGIAVISAFVTVRLSLSKFHSEKWWEKKAEAYGSIIESMHYMRKYCDEQILSIMESRELSKEREAELENRRKMAADKISKSIDLGSLIISENAAELLLDLEKKLHKAKKEDNWRIFWWHKKLHWRKRFQRLERLPAGI